MAGKRLNRDERARIAAGIDAGESDEEIAVEIGRARTTVWREIGRGGGRDAYEPGAAQKVAAKAGRRPKKTVLAKDPVLALLVLARLEDRWSPHAIAAWLRKRGDLRCCAESIYSAAYANDDCAGLPAGTWKLLPTHRRRRRGRRRGENCKRGNVLGPITLISERPAAAAEHRGLRVHQHRQLPPPPPIPLPPTTLNPASNGTPDCRVKIEEPLWARAPCGASCTAVSCG